MTFKSVKGVGAKTAQRLIVDLRDKVTAEDFALTSSGPADPMAEALQALVVLGYNRQAAEKALQKVRQEQPDEEVEGLIKKALQNL
jgi:Holliday junction DNA helicase RuvA